MCVSNNAVALLIVSCALAFPPRVQAESASKEDLGALDLEQLMQKQVVVTGSLLKKARGDVAQPVTVLEIEDLIRSGATNPEQIMQQVAQHQPAHVSNTTIGRRTGGATYANLRSLGSERTLVLVNGNRVADSPYETIGVDLNTVPIALVERIEVLPDGGSSTYGTDAIAGVVNFITVKELTGFNASATATTPERAGGGQTYLASLSGGYGSLDHDGWNVHAGATWRQARELPAAARDFSRTGFVPSRGINNVTLRSSPANYSQSESALDEQINPANPACSAHFLLFAEGIFGPRSCAYDILANVDLLTPQEQWSMLGKAAHRLGESRILSFEYIRGENRLRSVVSPQAPSGLTMSADNPYYPGQGITPGVAGLDPTLPIEVLWRTEELGRRESEIRGHTDRALVQLDGKVGSWDYQLSAMISTSTVNVILVNGFPDETRIQEGFSGANGAPFLNPFGPQSDAGLRYLEDSEILGEAQHTRGEIKVYNAQFNRALLRLPAGPVAFAAAIAFKSESARFANNPAITSAIPATFLDVNDVEGSRNSRSATAELNLPVLERLDLGVSARYDHYGDFGGALNPELSLRYEPFQWLVLRGSYSESFRTPTLYDIFQPRTISFTGGAYDDPILCPGGTANTAAGAVTGRDCNAFFDRSTGGNPDLDPEDSSAHSLGFQLQPLETLSIGLDYWSYHLKHTIGALADQAIFDDPAKYADRYVRCSQLLPIERARHEYCLSGGGGDPIAYIEDVIDNLGDIKTAGFDLTAGWTGPALPLGRFGLQYRGTYVSQYEFQRERGGPFFSRAGGYLDQSAVLRYVHFLSATWERGPWMAQLVNRYRSGYDDCNEQCDIEPQFFNDVRAFSVLDVSGTYQWNEQLEIAATIGNLFNRGPPFTNGGSALSNTWDDRYADPRLRTYLVTVRWKVLPLTK